MEYSAAPSSHAGGARTTSTDGAPVRPAPGGGAGRVVARSAIALLLGGVALAAQVPQRWTLGDSRERVRQVQGAPDLVERLTSLGKEIWSYRSSSVTFDPRTGHVVEYTDAEGALKVVMAPRGSTGAPSRGALALGSSRDAVLRRFGTPWAYTRDPSRRYAYLAYGRSVVQLALDDDRVSGWIVRDSAIVVARGDREAGEAAMRGGGKAPPTRQAAAPATLRASVAWQDDDRDGALAPGEGGRVTLTVANDGPGEARNVRASLAVESPATGVTVSVAPSTPTIASGSERDFTFRLAADSAQSASEIVIVARVSEANGFDLSPALRLRVAARAAGAPRLVVRDTRLDDASRDGRLAPREVGDLTIRVGNDGDAATPPLRARLWRGGDLFLAAGARDTFSLGAIPAGGTSTVTLSLYTNSRAADTGLRLELADARGRVLARLPIDLPLTKRPSGVLDVVAARDSSGTVERGALNSAAVDRDLPVAATRRPDAIAVLLGVERYKQLPDARFAERDVALMRRYAVEALGVNDDVEHLYARTGADVTGGELRKVFGEAGWLARRVTANTDLVVYWAGHGAPDAARRSPFLLPWDADPAFVSETGFALGDLFDRLARLPARSIVVILDACFTGVSRDGAALAPGARATVLSVEHPALVRRQMGVITAARGAQLAGDLPDARHGLLTYWIARGLRGEADADSNNAISIAELGRFAERHVRETAARLNRDQRPLTIARDTATVVARLSPGGTRP
ncbi:MAG: caspase family protein [Gemmatimonadaceae bacterium]|nr:caspase family protein [Gemmatimonadaceae bacterium]